MMQPEISLEDGEQVTGYVLIVRTENLETGQSDNKLSMEGFSYPELIGALKIWSSRIMGEVLDRYNP